MHNIRWCKLQFWLSGFWHEDPTTASLLKDLSSFLSTFVLSILWKQLHCVPNEASCNFLHKFVKFNTSLHKVNFQCPETIKYPPLAFRCFPILPHLRKKNIMESETLKWLHKCHFKIRYGWSSILRLSSQIQALFLFQPLPWGFRDWRST